MGRTGHVWRGPVPDARTPDARRIIHRLSSILPLPASMSDVLVSHTRRFFVAASPLRTRRPVRFIAAGLSAAVVGLQLVATVPTGAVGSTFSFENDHPSVGEPGYIGF